MSEEIKNDTKSKLTKLKGELKEELMKECSAILEKRMDEVENKLDVKI